MSYNSVLVLFSLMVFEGLFVSTTFANESQRSPSETFVAYFHAMDARQEEVANGLKTLDCTDNLHMVIHRLNIIDRLQPFYELTTANHALVVARPFKIQESDSDEVIFAELHTFNDTWRIHKLGRTSPENAAWLMEGFKIHPDVRLNLSVQALVGEWWYPCDSTVILNENGTGSDRMVGPVAPDPDQQPELFTWTVKGSTLTLNFADRQQQLVITAIDHVGVTFKTPNAAERSRWTRKDPH